MMGHKAHLMDEMVSQSKQKNPICRPFSAKKIIKMQKTFIIFSFLTQVWKKNVFFAVGKLLVDNNE